MTQDGRPIFDLVPHRERKGLNWAALETFKKERGIDSFFDFIPDDFDDPLPEDILFGDHPAWR